LPIGAFSPRRTSTPLRLALDIGAFAQELFLSIKTVETHLAAGYRKLGVNGRDEIAIG
jgi:DNA-binding NarL/FixJ family response regulator